MELDFKENEIAVLSSVNGRGKTTILSHIVDAFYELAKPHFPDDFAGREHAFYRVVSPVHSLVPNQPAFVYCRFKASEETVDYVEISNGCTEEQYNEAIKIENKIPFNELEESLRAANSAKNTSSSFGKEKTEKLFSSNILTYFPSYRYEQPGYLNIPYEVKLDFKKQFGFPGRLKNPIEVISGLPQLANWIMDVILDNQYLNVKPEDIKETLKTIGFNSEITAVDQIVNLINIVIQMSAHRKSEMPKNLNFILTHTLSSKNYGNLRFVVGHRGWDITRILIVNSETGEQIYPSIFNLSSGEASLLCLFGELLRQADNIRNNIQLSEITGIVLIDEIDKHLHIKLQKEVLPKLLSLFPNVQFIVSSHSPFLSMGLAEEAQERAKIIDLDNNAGISKDPATSELYVDVYNMMIGENERFMDMYKALEQEIAKERKPLIITEGKTDIKHLKKAKEKLNITNCDVDFFVPADDSWGDSKLKDFLEHWSKGPQLRKIIGIFDRDDKEIISNIEKGEQHFKNYGNNVFAFCIPIPKGRESYANISIEFYYTDSELKKEKDGKCLYFDNELNFNSKRKPISPILEPKDNNEKKIWCKNIGDLTWIHSKTRFAELVESDADFISDFNFDNFNLIFDKIKEIIKPSEETISVHVEENTSETI